MKRQNSKETPQDPEVTLTAVPSSEFFRNSDYQYQALKEPMALTKYGKRRYVIMPYEDYEQIMDKRFEQVIKTSRVATRASAMTDEQLQAIRDAKVPPEYEDTD